MRLFNTIMVVAAAMAASPVEAALLKPTPSQVLGPYYPKVMPAEPDTDLTRVPGSARRAEGKILYLSGKVLDVKGKPVQGARVEIWQANAKGRYDHPDDRNPAPLDPNFQGYGVQVTGVDGTFRFKTVKPAAYAAGTEMRPPHIHFIVTSAGKRLVTQMYFPGEPLNDKDPVSERDKTGLLARLSPAKGKEEGAMNAEWNIVLPE